MKSWIWITIFQRVVNLQLPISRNRLESTLPTSPAAYKLHRFYYTTIAIEHKRTRTLERLLLNVTLFGPSAAPRASLVRCLMGNALRLETENKVIRPRIGDGDIGAFNATTMKYATNKSFRTFLVMGDKLAVSQMPPAGPELWMLRPTRKGDRRQQIRSPKLERRRLEISFMEYCIFAGVQ